MRENKLNPDYEFYITNQILKPVSQIFGLTLENLKGFNGDIAEYNGIYDKKLKLGKTINEAKLMLEAKRKEAAKNIIWGYFETFGKQKEKQ